MPTSGLCLSGSAKKPFRFLQDIRSASRVSRFFYLFFSWLIQLSGNTRKFSNLPLPIHPPPSSMRVAESVKLYTCQVARNGSRHVHHGVSCKQRPRFCKLQWRHGYASDERTTANVRSKSHIAPQFLDALSPTATARP